MNVSESMSYELSQKLDQRGYEGQMALGYLDAINDLMKIEDRSYKNQPQLNENQQIVFEWLKGNYVQGYGAAVIRTIHLLQKENTVDISDSSYVRGAYRDLNTAEEAVVIKMFADWALEQEEEK